MIIGLIGLLREPKISKDENKQFFMANINLKDSNDSSSPPSSNSMRNKMNNNISLNKTSQDYIERNASKNLPVYLFSIRTQRNK
jgi:hypothetical protein